MNLNDIFGIDLEITGLTIDSRKVKPGYLFVCVDGINNDGHQYAQKAVDAGAICVLSSRNVEVSVKNIVVDDTSKMFSLLCNKFYDNPSSKMKVIGITGTDGKTTTTSILNQMLNVNNKSGYIGTNGIIYDNINYMLGHTTTPESDDLQRVLSEMYKCNIEYVNLEVTSHALSLERTRDVMFDVVGITNVTSEHMDMHGTIDNYINAKKQLFKYESRVKILNVDDKHFNEFSDGTRKFITYGINNVADYQAINISCLVDCIKYDLVYKGNVYFVEINLIGKFNVYNTLLAIAVCNNLGFEIEECVRLLKYVNPVDGRSIFIDQGQDFYCVVDFAHTPAGIEQITNYFRELFSNGENKLIVVVGSAGDRDKTKRSLIGNVVSKNADIAIYTNEDPRSEDEMSILKDIAKGSANENYLLIPDRKTAIMEALKLANTNDVVLMLGKGIENSIEFFDGEVSYNEIEIVKECLKTL